MIEQTEEDSDTVVLTCTAEANPPPSDAGPAFLWTRNGNETMDGEEAEVEAGEGLRSVLRLPASRAIFGEYQCKVDNEVGEGEPCVIRVQGALRGLGIAEAVVLVVVVDVVDFSSAKSFSILLKIAEIVSNFELIGSRSKC